MNNRIVCILWNFLLLSFVSQLYTEAFIAFLDGDQDIIGRAGCNYEKTCCADTAGATLNWFASGGQPLGNSSNIIVTNRQIGELRCVTIGFHPATVGRGEYTCFGQSGNNFVSRNFQMIIPRGSTPRSIEVDGDTKKNITGRNVGDTVTASCTVKSCLTGTYRIRFIDRKNIEISNRLFNETEVTDTVNIVLGTNSSGLYKCEVINAVDGKVEDTAMFELVGLVNFPTPTVTTPTQTPPPVLQRCFRNVKEFIDTRKCSAGFDFLKIISSNLSDCEYQLYYSRICQSQKCLKIFVDLYNLCLNESGLFGPAGNTEILDAVVSSYTNLYCAKEPKHKDFCGVLFPEFANSNKPLPFNLTCAVKGDRCSSDCREIVNNATEHYGCCLSRYLKDFFKVNAQETYRKCGVPQPPRCRTKLKDPREK